MGKKNTTYTCKCKKNNLSVEVSKGEMCICGRPILTNGRIQQLRDKAVD